MLVNWFCIRVSLPKEGYFCNTKAYAKEIKFLMGIHNNLDFAGVYIHIYI